jgi:lysophospholipase L1-like esterase
MEVERVVFLGDSITVGTPPTPSQKYYRSQLAEALADRFALDTGADFDTWKGSSVGNGTSEIMQSGAFWSCAKWGARNDDFLTGGMQIEACFPEDTWDQKTLVIITMGGNDLLSFAQDLADGVPVDEVQPDVQQMLDDKRAALEWLTDGSRFPNGNSIVFANVYEFTDGTADFLACPLAGTVGFDTPLEDSGDLLLIVGFIQQEYAKMAAELGLDFIFMFEQFCGHGYHSDDPDAPCYRGPGNDNWFDGTCIHPTSTGHGVIADSFLAVIDE